MKNICIYNTTIITQNDNRDIYHNINLIIKDGIIEDISTERININDFMGYKLIDGSAFFLTPGFINAHIHLGESAYKNCFKKKFTLEEYIKKTDKISKKIRIIETKRNTICKYSLLLALKSGTTTICGGRTYDVCKRWGIRNLSMYMLMNSPKLENCMIDSYKKIKESLKKGETGGIFIHSLNRISLKELGVVKRIKKEFPYVKIGIHVGETQEQEVDILRKYGETAIMILDKYGLLDSNTLLVHCCNLSKLDIQIIKKKGANIVTCLNSNLMVSDKTLDIKTIQENNIGFCLGTDGLVTSGSLDILGEANMNIRYHNGFHKGILNPQKMLDIITRDGASILGLNTVGSLEIGKGADVLIFKKKYNKNYIEQVFLNKNNIYGLIAKGDIKIWKNKVIGTQETESKIRTSFNSILKIVDESNIS